ncbi:MAG: methionyl-tRNA formyltransferase, partial [Candidatus Cryptobacteroides sp.]
FVISVGAFFIADDLVPIAYNKIFTLRDDIGRTKEEIKIPTGTFYNGIEGYVLRVEDRNDETGMMYKAMVYDHSAGKKGNVSLTIADSALMKMSQDKSYLTFTLFNGTNYEETNTRKYRDTTLQLQKIDFRRQDMIIPLKNYAFQKSNDDRFSDEVRTLGLKELTYRQDSIGTLNSKEKDGHLQTLEKSTALKYNSQLDTASKRIPSSNFDYSRIEEIPIDKQITMREKAVASANEMIADLTTFSRESFHYTFTLRCIGIEIFNKFALALACFIFFFIGAPLGAILKKGGLGSSAIISVMFFVLYWVIDISGKKLARDGAVSPEIGVFISSLVLLPIGIFLTYKAINDSSLFNIDKVKEILRKIRYKIMGQLKKTRIVYMGTPEFAVGPLDALIKNGHNIVGVVTVADKASGRGLKVNESAVKKYAVEHGIPILQPVSLKDPEFLEQLKGWKADIFVVVAFRMLPKVVWEMPKMGTFNLHAALLPQYRGAAPINWAVINGDNVTGVTTFMIDEGIDTGNIMMREQCKIEETDTAGDVHDKLMAIGSELVVETVESIMDKNVELRLQKSFIQGAEVLKPAPKLTRELCHIDWNGTVKEIYNLIRGLSPYPAAYTELVKDGKTTQMKIFKTEKVTGKVFENMLAECGAKYEGPGRILSDGKTFLAITAADGAISVKELQIAGKKRMEINDFLLGFREPQSYTLTQGTSSAFIGKHNKK